VEPDELEEFVAFFRDFVDGCHHEKEERGLFAVLAQQGLAREGTPIAQMVDEHAWNRGLLGRLRKGLELAGTGDPQAVGRVIEQGGDFCRALRRHIDKEEHCVFGLAERQLRGPALEALRRADREIEAEPDHRATVARCVDLAGRLLARAGVAPPPARPAEPEVARPRAGSAGSAGSEGEAWRAWATPLAPEPGSELAEQVERALASPPVARLRGLLECTGRRLDPQPLLWKQLPGPYLRLFFTVAGPTDAIEEGEVVAVVLLHDLASECTLYAHPIHAGPGANPLLRHVGGPMANPKAQAGRNGEPATRRLLEHKYALWSRFQEECETRGPAEAGRRWRERYAWALVRLYFCERCAACRWGSPGFDGAGDSVAFRSPVAADPAVAAGVAEPGGARPAGFEPVAVAICASEAWQIEARYAQRGGFTLGEAPTLVAPLEDDHVLAVFGSDAEWLDGGSIVGAAAWLHRPSGEVRHVHCLVAGPEAERVFLDGDRALGLPRPGATRPEARTAYVRWRREAWARFWQDELELGLHAASRRWLRDHQTALATLAGVA